MNRRGRPRLHAWRAYPNGPKRSGGVHPTVWKLEGYETTEGAQEVLRTVSADSENPAECIVLGRNAPMSRVEHWIETAAPLSGFAGFAVGRSIWQEPLQQLLAGEIERSEAVETIAGRYRTLIDDYGAHRHRSASQSSEVDALRAEAATPASDR
jgi:myo-inositol catabolism protein IolC